MPTPTVESNIRVTEAAWSPVNSMLQARDGHTATLLADGRVLIVRGKESSTPSGVPPFLASAEIYDPSADSWTTVGTLAQSRSDHQAVLLADERVLILGGRGGSIRLASAEIFDPSTDSWSPAGILAQARESNTATLLMDGRVLVVGGRGEGETLGSAEIFDPSTNPWTPAGTLAHARSGHQAILLVDGRVLVVAGKDE